MKKFLSGLMAALVFVTGTAFAQSHEVKLKMNIVQPTLYDKSKQDTFDGSVDDGSGTTSFKLVCSAESAGTLGINQVNEACTVKGGGVIKNPNNPSQTLPRVNYSGGFMIDGKRDGYTGFETLKAEYLRVGSAPADSSSFKGNLGMMPENPPASAKALGERLLKSLSATKAGKTGVKFDNRIDSIRFNNFTVPHVGLASSQSCSWTGDLIFAYVNEAWQGSFTVKCGDATYQVEGNMPLVEAPAGSSHQQEYRLNLVLAGKGSADPFAAADPFATVNGVVGTMQLKNSGRSVEGVFENVTVTGDLKGTGVPLELTRSFGQIMIVLARTFFGA